MICDVTLNSVNCELDTGCKCYSCGGAACRGCSRIATKYYHWKNKRICNDCIEDRAREIRRGQIVLEKPPEHPLPDVPDEPSSEALIDWLRLYAKGFLGEANLPTGNPAVWLRAAADRLEELDLKEKK